MSLTEKEKSPGWPNYDQIEKYNSQKVSDWLERYRDQKSTLQSTKNLTHKRATTISFTSGKGGVGKTTLALRSALSLSEQGYRVLLIDCDYNLSNTAIKIGLPIGVGLKDYFNGTKKFNDCIYQKGKFHLLSACNGDLDFFDTDGPFSREVLALIVEKESFYDFIIIDCAAGVARNVVDLCAYTDYRFVVVTPDKSSITDSYSLIKILHRRFGVRSNHLLVNKYYSMEQYRRIVKTMSTTVESFLEGRLQILGGVEFVDQKRSDLDSYLIQEAKTAFGQSVTKLLTRFAEELETSSSDLSKKMADQVPLQQEVCNLKSSIC